MFCTTIIPTIGRESLDRAVQSVLDQDFDEVSFEIIIVNDSGFPLKPADWQQSNQITIINTKRRERCIARNTGAGIAKGQYLHFLDDDDWLLPGALESLWNLAQNSNKKWLYGSTQLVDLEGEPIIQLHHHLFGNCFIKLMAGEWIPLQSSLIDTDTFFSVGGFDAQVTKSEDVDIARRVSRHWDFAYTKTLISCLERGGDRTKYYSQSQLITRGGAEKILLDQPGVFRRMHDSADANYWFGKIIRVVLSSMDWNIRNKRYLTAIIRLLQTILAFMITVPYIFSKSYWKAIFRSHKSEVFEEAHKPVMS